MHLVAVFVGCGTFVVVLAGALALRRIPVSRACPDCATPTSPIQGGFWLGLVRPKLHRRWCSACGWTGVRRSRAPVAPTDEPPAHESGFHWARPDPSDAPLFVWRDDGRRRGRGPSSRGGRPDSERPRRRSTDPDPTPHRTTGEGPSGDPVHPSGFRWGDGPAEDAPVFLWRDDEDEAAGGS